MASITSVSRSKFVSPAEAVYVPQTGEVWVSQARGSVGGTGAYHDPFDTMAAGLAAVADGEVLMVEPGTYAEACYLQSYCTVKATVPGSVLIQPTGMGESALIITPAWLGAAGADEKILLEGLILRASSDLGGVPCNGLHVDYSAGAAGANNFRMMVRDCVIDRDVGVVCQDLRIRFQNSVDALFIEFVDCTIGLAPSTACEIYTDNGAMTTDHVTFTRCNIRDDIAIGGAAGLEASLMFRDCGLMAGTLSNTGMGNSLVLLHNSRWGTIDASVSAGILQIQDRAMEFWSAIQTGTGASMNIPHGLGFIPSRVMFLLAVTTGGGDTIVEGATDATDVVCTATLNCQFFVIARP